MIGVLALGRFGSDLINWWCFFPSRNRGCLSHVQRTTYSAADSLAKDGILRWGLIFCVWRFACGGICFIDCIVVPSKLLFWVACLGELLLLCSYLFAILFLFFPQYNLSLTYHHYQSLVLTMLGSAPWILFFHSDLSWAKSSGKIYLQLLKESNEKRTMQFLFILRG